MEKQNPGGGFKGKRGATTRHRSARRGQATGADPGVVPWRHDWTAAPPLITKALAEIDLVHAASAGLMPSTLDTRAPKIMPPQQPAALAVIYLNEYYRLSPGSCGQSDPGSPEKPWSKGPQTLLDCRRSAFKCRRGSASCQSAIPRCRRFERHRG